MWSLKRRHPRLSASGSHCYRHLECKGSGQENILLLHLDGHGCRHHWHSRQSTVTPVYWRRVKTEAFRAGEGFVSRIRLENIKSCRLANVWIATRIRSNDCGVPGTPRMRRVHSLVEGDRCDTSRRHAPCCATQQPACGMATRRRADKVAAGEKQLLRCLIGAFAKFAAANLKTDETGRSRGF